MGISYKRNERKRRYFLSFEIYDSDEGGWIIMQSWLLEETIKLKIEFSKNCLARSWWFFKTGSVLVNCQELTILWPDKECNLFHVPRSNCNLGNPYQLACNENLCTIPICLSDFVRFVCWKNTLISYLLFQ